LIVLKTRYQPSETHIRKKYESSETPIRKKSKLGMQRNEVQPAVASVGTVPDVSIRHEPELRGAFAAMAKKETIRFTSYQES
jgi:hypothetical protein